MNMAAFKPNYLSAGSRDAVSSTSDFTAPTQQRADMHAAVQNSTFLIDTPWYRKLAWAVAALLIHASILGLAAMFYQAPQQAPEIMNVSLLPMSEPAATPPAPAPKSQPVVKHMPPKPVVMPKPAPTTSPTAISQAQPATSAAPATESQSTSAPSGANKPTNEAVVPAHDAAYLNNPKPAYPTQSRRLGESGSVLMSVYVLPNGTASKVEIAKSSGYPRLDQAALDAVKRWTFVPAKRGSEAIATIGATGQASLDKVAGPVGEALIMTAAGLFVAIPAVLAYNAFSRGLRVINSELDAFATDLHTYFTTGRAIATTQNGGKRIAGVK
jgi:protein TonB